MASLFEYEKTDATRDVLHRFYCGYLVFKGMPGV